MISIRDADHDRLKEAYAIGHKLEPSMEERAQLLTLLKQILDNIDDLMKPAAFIEPRIVEVKSK
jgi:hypothetical protein